MVKDSTPREASSVNDSDDGGVWVATHGYKDVDDEWIIDFDQSFHMTSYKDFLSTVEI